MEDAGAYNEAAQLERTVLAWNRSSLAVAANGALLAREGFVRDVTPLTAVGFLVVGIAAAVWVLSIARYPSARAAHASNLLAGHARLVAAFAVFVGLLSVGDLVLAAR